jgi:hypothetical protein
MVSFGFSRINCFSLFYSITTQICPSLTRLHIEIQNACYTSPSFLFSFFLSTCSANHILLHTLTITEDLCMSLYTGSLWSGGNPFYLPKALVLRCRSKLSGFFHYLYMTKQGWHWLGRGMWRHAWSTRKEIQFGPAIRSALSCLCFQSAQPSGWNPSGKISSMFLYLFTADISKAEDTGTQALRAGGNRGWHESLLLCCNAQSRRNWPTFQRCLLPISLEKYHPDDGGSKHLWNFGKFLPEYIWQHSRRLWSRQCLPWEH